MTSRADTMLLALDEGIEVQISIRRSKRARRILLHVGSYDGKIEIVLPPGCSQREGIGFALTQKAWVARQLSRIGAPVPFADGTRFPLLGETIAIRLSDAGSALPTLSDGDLVVGGREDTLAGRVRRWVRARALDEIEPRARTMASQIGRAAQRVAVRDTRSRWGSCSRAGNLNFSWRLVMAPEHVLDYVVAHEVSHLAEMNHGNRFWSVVADICPEHETARRWLRRNGAELHRYGRDPETNVPAA